MQCCSGTACAAAERQFGPEIAQRDIQRYHRNGPDRVTRALLEGVRAVVRDCRSLLDVGGGVGVVAFELLGGGLAEATVVDGSPWYVAAAGREAERRGQSRRMRLVAGDFTALAESIGPADVVTMHRVVCCFPDWEALLGAASARCRQVFAFSYPHDRWYVRAVLGLENVRRRLTGNPFRTFVHPPPQMRTILERAGFVRVDRRHTAVWSVDVYRRE